MQVCFALRASFARGYYFILIEQVLSFNICRSKLIKDLLGVVELREVYWSEQLKYALDITGVFLNTFSILYFMYVQALVTLALDDPVTLEEDY